ncbi:hypothetical protein HanRHA438_Chr02g0082991 [Helianthus annuus]|nr:hypothetical protein HanRHA438_Chr02g0082991 [Helianthus annuus]
MLKAMMIQLSVLAGLSTIKVYVFKQDRDGRISWHAFDPIYQIWQPLPLIPMEYSDVVEFACAVSSISCLFYVCF